MPFTIKHAKTNNIADWTQAQLNTIISGGAAPLPPAGTVLNDVTLSSDWNNDHTFTGILPIANGGTNASTENGAVTNLVNPLPYFSFPFTNSGTKEVPFYDNEAGFSAKTTIQDIISQASLDGAPLFKQVITKTANYTIDPITDGTILCDVSAGGFTITLPNATLYTGKQFLIIKSDLTQNNFLTLATTSSQTINGDLTLTTKRFYTAWLVQSDGANWDLVNANPQPLDVSMEVIAVNAKTVAATKIDTTRSSTRRFIPRYAIVYCRSASAITVPATISIGTNSATYDNILPATALTGVTAAQNYLHIPLGAAAISGIAASTDIYVNVSTAATGTSQTLDVLLVGIYRG